MLQCDDSWLCTASLRTTRVDSTNPLSPERFVPSSRDKNKTDVPIQLGRFVFVGTVFLFAVTSCPPQGFSRSQHPPQKVSQSVCLDYAWQPRTSGCSYSVMTVECSHAGCFLAAMRIETRFYVWLSRVLLLLVQAKLSNDQEGVLSLSQRDFAYAMFKTCCNHEFRGDSEFVLS